MDFGPEFSTLAAIAGSKDDGAKRDDKPISKKQWILIILLGLAVGIGIHLWLAHSGL